MSAMNARTAAGLDFSKLAERSLLAYCGLHDLPSGSGGYPHSKPVLVATCAHHFTDRLEVSEEDTLEHVQDIREHGSPSRELPGAVKFRKRGRAQADGGGMGSLYKSQTRPSASGMGGGVGGLGGGAGDRGAFTLGGIKSGEKVAAKVGQVRATDD
jgi:hypothetical protein